MTLKPYSPEMLDQFALRLMDLACLLRGMANRCREYEITDFVAHEKKPIEWYHNLERWVRKCQTELEMRVIEARARRRALSSRE